MSGPDFQPTSGAGPTHAILLAAGLSRRMGQRNKLLAEIDSEPMAHRAARTLIECGFRPIVIVGHERDQVEAALAGLDVTVRFNPDYEQGQASSVRTGLGALPADHGDVLICLADQPKLERSDIEALIRAFNASDRERVLTPVFEGQRGNPIIIPKAIVRAIGDGPANFACRKFIEANPSRILRFDVRNDHYTHDIDTVEELNALAE